MTSTLAEPHRPSVEVVEDDDTSCRRSISPWILAGLVFILYSMMAIQRDRVGITSGYDLGIFEEAIRNYAHGHLPWAPLKGAHFDLLGDHFHPILILLAPLYRFWPLGPARYSLLISQAALFALGLVPLMRWAEKIGRWAMWCTGAGMAVSWGLVNADTFDFHEIAFAVPLISFSAAALGQGRYRAALWWAVPLVLVKEDLGLTVAVIGILLWRKGHRPGLRLAWFGVAATVVETQLIIPAIHGHYEYSNNLQPGIFLQNGMEKMSTVAVLFAPVAFIAFRSSLCWLVVPTLLWRFMGTNPFYWGLDLHYSAVLEPMIYAAAIDAFSRVGHPHVERRLLIGCTVGAVLSAWGGPIGSAFDPSTWTIPHHQRVLDAMVKKIPSNVTVGTTVRAAAQLTGKDAVSFACDASFMHPTWLLLDSHDPSTDPQAPGGDCTSKDVTNMKRWRHYRVVSDWDGIWVLRKT
ncbi:DUF2079 domain-containing protein [Streptomyces sp. RB6PN25]|uniref:DUF2079 domain-containing protein n=1 Tax=Streptomyces humicola TaxID=2953240 RepID=A0ABT1PSB1_9ACTN|nr:DUF2079 domain-containing protein [Streptomyces humicola]MCQ4079447.1 DUF2079 domain-containing protein [Streptomyces humicola]